MIDIERIEKALKNHEIEKDTERHSVITTEIRNKSKEEIADFLCRISPKEMGGITAMSGFYYQILVTIEYLIELIDGKWDFVAIELHDDIVVGKDKYIKFIQVKTSKDQAVLVTQSPANGLYLRKTKESNKNKYLINSSWVDKLLSKSEYFSKSDGYQTEFELHSSYNILQAQKYNFDYYYEVCGIREKLNKNDHLLDIISKPVYDNKLNEYDYLDKTGETLEELLNRFSLKVGKKLTDLRAYKNHLRVELGEKLLKNINGKNIILSENDLNILIGHLFGKCTVSGDYLTLIITQEDLNGLLKELMERMIQGASETTTQHGNIEISSQVFDVLISQLKRYPIYDYIKDDIFQYKNYIENWYLNEGGNIRDLINRYIEGTKNSEIYYELPDRVRQEKIEDFIFIMIIINLVHNDILTFAECESLLSKQKLTDVDNIITFLSLDPSFNFSIGVEKLQDIYAKLSLKDQLFYDSKKVKTVFQKYIDREFTNTQSISLKRKHEIPLQELNSGEKLNEVVKVVDVVPGELVRDEFYKLSRVENKETLLKGLKAHWENL